MPRRFFMVQTFVLALIGGLFLGTVLYRIFVGNPVKTVCQPPLTEERREAIMEEIGNIDVSDLHGAQCPKCGIEKTAWFGGVCLQCSNHPLAKGLKPRK
jgi:hypothetical protein